VDGKAYVYRAPSEKDAKEKAWETPVAWEAAGKGKFRAVGYADGHCEQLDEKAWEKLVERFKISTEK
jgi:hypothetical protein